MKKLIALAIAGAALAVALIPGAAAARQTIQSDLDLVETTDLGAEILASGIVFSEKAKCRRERKVVFKVESAGKQRRLFNTVDATRSSTRGAWAFVVPEADIDGGAWKIKMPAKKVGDDTCTGDLITPP